MDYKKKSLNKLNQKESYEEIDTRLASGWYVDDINSPKKKIYKTKKTSFKLSKKLNSQGNNFTDYKLVLLEFKHKFNSQKSTVNSVFKIIFPFIKILF